MESAARSERLRRHLRRHNRRVWMLAGATALAAASMWGALYLIVWWLLLLGGAAGGSFDYKPPAARLGGGFAATIALLCLVAWFTRRLRPDEAARDRKPPWEHALDLLLAAPRVTLSVYGTCAAAARLSEAELEQAQRLIERIEENGKPLPAHETPLEIPDDDARHRVLMALQLSGVIELRASKNGPVLAFASAAARRLGQQRVRLRK